MTERWRRVDELAGMAMQAPWLAPTVADSMTSARQNNLHQIGDDAMNLHHLHRRLDRLDGLDGLGLGEVMEQAQAKREARQRAWTAAGHPGQPPREPLPPADPNAPRAGRELWRKIAQGTARVIHATTPGSPFATLQDAYALDDDALMAAINGHPLYAGWPEYDNRAA